MNYTMSHKNTNQFKFEKTLNTILVALNNGYCCLLPTDTIPGLCFSPTSLRAKNQLYKIKQRTLDKPLVSLVKSPQQALELFDQLPNSWEKFLSNHWPKSTTIIWKAGVSAPKNLIYQDGTIALRLPTISQNCFLKSLLDRFQRPLPATSVNVTGQKPISNWEEAQIWCQSRRELIVPEIEKDDLCLSSSSTPSSLIKILDAKNFTIIRNHLSKVSKNMLKSAKLEIR